MHDPFLTFAIILIIAMMTWITRGLPYILFSKKAIPEPISYLGTVLPASIMVILVVYCLRNTKFSAPPFGVPEILSLALSLLIQIWRKNTIISIIVGTACYMLLIRFVFPLP